MEEKIDLIQCSIVVVLLIMMFGIIIYEAATTTYEHISIDGKVTDKEIRHYQKPVYVEDEDGFRRVASYTDEVHYYLVCNVDNSEIEVQVNFVEYIKYAVDDIAPLTKTVGYKKGTDEIKSIFYELRKI